MGWEIEVPADEQYELYLIASVPRAGNGKDLYLNAGGKVQPLKLRRTHGVFANEAINFQRIKSQVSHEGIVCVTLEYGPSFFCLHEVCI